ncbi:MAG: hypothetical protein ACP5G2_05860 [Candidatus Bipolaricaulaceae bacterium]
MVEVLIERDEEGRVQAVSLRGEESPEGLAAAALLEGPVMGMRHYLRLAPEVEREGAEVRFRVDRSDIFLDRELDAILETMVLGFRWLERDRPDRVAVREVGMDIKV